jgi:hypothetical protein
MLNIKESIEITVDSYRDVISACLNLLPGFRNSYFSLNLHKQLTIVDNSKVISTYELDFSPRSSDLYIVPTVSGGINSTFDSLGNLSVFYGEGLSYSNQVLDYNMLSRRILDSSLFGKADTAFDISQRKNNREIFFVNGNNTNTTAKIMGSMLGKCFKKYGRN